MRIRQRAYEILESTRERDRIARVAQVFLMALIFLNVAAVIIETVEAVAARHGVFFFWFEVLSVAAFTVEYVLRVWSCTEQSPDGFRHPVATRLRHMVRPLALVDLIAILPFYLAIIFPVDLRFMRAFRLLRVLKLTRYSPALDTLGKVLYNERRALTGVLLIMIVLLIIFSSFVYIAERDAQPEAFASIPHAMWWGLATLTTVGYGDVAPVTALGRLLGSVTIVLGVGMFALPAGILASGFAEEIKRRDFVVSWNLVAEVPLFARLLAARIAEIAALLRPRLAESGETIIRRGEPGEFMLFIVSGEVEVNLQPTPVRLSAGEFFGEIALIEKVERSADVVARTQAQLLVLDRAGFDHFLGSEPDVR